MAKIRISELREIIKSVLEEDMGTFQQPGTAQPPPLPAAANAQKPASAALCTSQV